MGKDDFIAMLAAEQFNEPITVEREADGSMDAHSHPFEAKALVLQGELTIRVGDTERLYRAGDVFHLLAQVLHEERYGPTGVSYLVGRK